MSSSGPIGEISVKGENEVEWTIQDIFSDSYTAADVYYNSPRFDAAGSRWFLYIYPFGQTKNNSLGWMFSFVSRLLTSPPSEAANITFSLRRADGTVENVNRDLTWVFHGKGIGYASSKLLQRSELARRKSELAPSGALTVTCSFGLNKDTDSSADMDKLSLDFVDMFTSERGCDATLKVKHREFSVHKLILSARSPVFAAMFDADMKEKTSGIVDIVDCDPEAFREFLKYLYSGRADNLSSNAFELYRIADKYGVGELKSACLVFIMTNLTVENVLDAALLGRQFSENALKVKVQDFFNGNFGEIVSTAEWASFMKANCHLANELLKRMGAEMKSEKMTKAT